MDRQMALRHMGGSNQAWSRSALHLKKDMLLFLPTVRMALRLYDVAKVRALLHNLRGACLAMGLLRLAQQLQATEGLLLQGNDQDLENTSAAMACLQACMQESEAALDSALAALDMHPCPRPDRAISAQEIAALDRGMTQLIALLKLQDLEALACYAELRAQLALLPDPLRERLDRAMQALDLEEAQLACRAIRIFWRPLMFA